MTATARSTIRRRILDGETLFGAWTDMASPKATEITGRAGYDWLKPSVLPLRSTSSRPPSAGWG